jgi:hypothetical protein
MKSKAKALLLVLALGLGSSVQAEGAEGYICGDLFYTIAKHAAFWSEFPMKVVEDEKINGRANITEVKELLQQLDDIYTVTVNKAISSNCDQTPSRVRNLEVILNTYNWIARRYNIRTRRF